jgi:hypothetical protein
MLVANPLAVQNMKDLKLNQLESNQFSYFMQHGFLIKNDFLDNKFLETTVSQATKRLELLEMEGKF